MSARRGFTLLELSIVLVIIALVTGMAITSGISAVASVRLSATQQKMKVIDDALMSYRSMNDRLPCPGDLTLPTTNTNYGLEAGSATGSSIAVGTGVCTGTGMNPAANFTGSASATSDTVAEGALPAFTLGLPADAMVDGWGNRFRYAVDINYTAANAFPSLGAACSLPAITVDDSNGNARTTAGVYALISSGANGHGAYTKNGAVVNAGSVNTNEQTNCHCNSSATATTYAPIYVQMLPTLDPTTSYDNFDDIVSYKERWQLQTPWDQAACSYVYVSDDNNNRIQVFSLTGAFVGQIGCSGTSACSGGSGNGQFSSLTTVAADSNGYIYAEDRPGNTPIGSRIQKFTSSGTYLSTPITAGNGTGEGAQASGVSDLWENASQFTVDSYGNFWVIQAANNFRLDEFASNGQYLKTVGGDKGDGTHTCTQCGSTSSCTCYTGSGIGQFGSSSVFADSSGDFYVLDGGGAPATQRITKWNAKTGTYIATIGGDLGDGTHTCTQCSSISSCTCYSNTTGSTGAYAGQPGNPIGIAFDNSGNVYIGSKLWNSIQKFNSSGTVTNVLFGTSGTGNGQFNGMNQMAIDPSGNLWIADSGNNRVQKVSPQGTFLLGIGSGYQNAGGSVGATGTGPGQFNFGSNVNQEVGVVVSTR